MVAMIAERQRLELSRRTDCAPRDTVWQIHMAPDSYSWFENARSCEVEREHLGIASPCVVDDRD